METDNLLVIDEGIDTEQIVGKTSKDTIECVIAQGNEQEDRIETIQTDEQANLSDNTTDAIAEIGPNLDSAVILDPEVPDIPEMSLPQASEGNKAVINNPVSSEIEDGLIASDTETLIGTDDQDNLPSRKVTGSKSRTEITKVDEEDKQPCQVVTENKLPEAIDLTDFDSQIVESEQAHQLNKNKRKRNKDAHIYSRIVRTRSEAAREPSPIPEFSGESTQMKSTVTETENNQDQEIEPKTFSKPSNLKKRGKKGKGKLAKNVKFNIEPVATTSQNQVQPSASSLEEIDPEADIDSAGNVIEFETVPELPRTKNKKFAKSNKNKQVPLKHAQGSPNIQYDDENLEQIEMATDQSEAVIKPAISLQKSRKGKSKVTKVISAKKRCTSSDTSPEPANISQAETNDEQQVENILTNSENSNSVQAKKSKITPPIAKRQAQTINPVPSGSKRTRAQSALARNSRSKYDQGIFDTVNNLNQVLIENILLETTKSIVRPCFSYTKLTNGAITKTTWDYYVKFAEFYLARIEELGYATIFQCTFDSGIISPKEKKHKLFGIYARFNNNKGEDIFLVLYECIDPKFKTSELLKYQLLGEISFQPRSKINTSANKKLITRYLKDKKPVFRNLANVKVFKARPTMGRCDFSGALPDLSQKIPDRFGNSIRLYNEVSANDFHLEQQDLFVTQYLIFCDLIHKLKELNKETKLLIFPQIVGDLSHVSQIRNKLNRYVRDSELPGVLGPNTSAQQIDRILAKDKPKDTVLVLLISFNEINTSFARNIKHSSVGIFQRRDGILKYKHFDSTKEDHDYLPLCSTMKQIISYFRSDDKRKRDVQRSYGNQVKGTDCFEQSLKYMCLINDNYDYEISDKWSWNKDDKFNKTPSRR